MLSRISTSSSRRLPSILTAAARRNTSSVKEGSVAQSQGFNKKEKAHEDQFVREHEQAQLRKLKEEIAKKKAELEQLEQKHDQVSSSAEKK